MSSTRGNQAIVQVLREEICRIKVRNPSYSLRAFAQRLDIRSSALSEIMNGKRSVSTKLAQRILAKVDIPPDRKRGVFQEIEARKKMKPSVERERHILEADKYTLIANYYHYAILSLIETFDFRFDTVWISQRLRLSIRTVKNALRRLERLGLISMADGKCTPRQLSISSPDNVATPGLKTAHLESMELAKEALHAVDVEKRDFIAMTMAIDPQKINEAKKITRSYLTQMESTLESGHRTEVYKLCIQLFPLTSQEDLR